jgi:hypothetical protein
LALEQPQHESHARLAARRRQTNRLIAVGLALCIITIFAASIAFAIADHGLSGQPLVQ